MVILLSTDLESFFKVTMFLQERSKVNDNLRSCNPQIKNPIIYSFRGLKKMNTKVQNESFNLNGSLFHYTVSLQKIHSTIIIH